ncbi:MAG: sensor histidine kinase [Gemmatimonadaceae bacterium]
MPRRERAQVRLIVVGLLTWLLSATAGAITLHARGQMRVGWLVAQGLFGVAFWVNTRTPWELRRGRLEIAALSIQVASALLIAAWSNYGFEGALFVIIAGQAPFSLSRPNAWLLVVAQTAAAGLLGAALDRPLGSLEGLAMYLALEVFALGAATLAIDEFRARRALLRVHSELLATQALLAESSRHAERLRIARALHDDLGHQLTALSLQLEVASQVAQGLVAERISVSQRLTRELLTDIREVVGTLRAEPPIALEGALRALASGFPHPRIHLTLPDLTIDHPAHAEAIFHCVQEALTNAARHADARNVWVELVVGPEGVEVHARDDGHGTETISPGHGLAGMRERLEQVGGRLDLQSTPGRGFTVRAWVPRLTRSA